MQTIQKVYISGLGAIGSIFASKLYAADPGLVTIIADRERTLRYQRNGFTVNGKAYPFRFVQPETKGEQADLLLIAVKQHQLARSIADIRNFVGEKTMILSLLNGITSEEIVGRAYGMDKMLFSFVVATDAVRVGTHTRFTNSGRIVFGEKKNEVYSPKVTAVKALFDRTGIAYQIPADMIRELWWKFMMNVGVNQISAILRAPYGTFRRVKEARELMEMASREVVLLAEKAGIDLTEGDIRAYAQVIDNLSPEGKSSMLQDIEAGRKTEVEIFGGTVVELGRRYGISTPVNDCLLRMIAVLEQTQQ